MSKLPENLKQWHNIVTETAKISELKEGDLVLQSGLVWRLKNHRSFPPAAKSKLPIHLFDSDPVGYWHSEESTVFPWQWLDNWHAQSNDLKNWTVVEDNSYREDAE